MSLSFYHHLYQYPLHHYTSQFFNQSLMGYSILLLLCLAATTYSLTPSNEVSNPKLIQSSTDFTIVSADTTVPYHIPTPQQIISTVEITIKQGSNCETVRQQPSIIAVNNISFIKNDTLMSLDGWNVQIMNFKYNQTSNVLYVLLDNGTLITTGLSAHVSQQNFKIYSRQSIGAIDSWLEQHYELILYENEVYALTNEQLFKLTLHSEGFWTKQTTAIKSNVMQVGIYQNIMYILTLNGLFSYHKNQLTIIQTGEKLVDFLYLKNNLYLLDRKKGIVQLTSNVYKEGVKESVWQIEQPDKALRIKGIDSTLFIIYQIGHRNYIAEYFIQYSQLVLNRYYHNYYQVRDIHLTHHHAILDAYNEFIILEHSVNRKSFSKLTPLQQIFKSSAAKVTGIHIINSKVELIYMVGFKQSILVFVAQPDGYYSNGLGYGFNTLSLQCNNNQSTKIDLVAQFKGLCSAYVSNKDNYCQVTVPMVINFEYNHIRKNQTNKGHRLIIWILLFVFTVVSLIGCIICRQKLNRLHQQLKQNYQRLKNKKQQHSVKMENTFNSEIPKS